MGLPERIADLTRDLSLEKQAEVLDFVEFLRKKGAPSTSLPRGSMEALHAALEAPEPPAEDEPEWSPFDIEKQAERGYPPS